MISPKKWQAGVADDVWKIIICARDHEQTTQTLHFLSYVLTEAGGDEALGLSMLRRMSGEQIVDGLIAYRESSRLSVANGLRKHG